MPYLGFEGADAAALLLDNGLARVDEVEHGLLVYLGGVACEAHGLAGALGVVVVAMPCGGAGMLAGLVLTVAFVAAVMTLM